MSKEITPCLPHNDLGAGRGARAPTENHRLNDDLSGALVPKVEYARKNIENMKKNLEFLLFKSYNVFNEVVTVSGVFLNDAGGIAIRLI